MINIRQSSVFNGSLKGLYGILWEMPTPVSHVLKIHIFVYIFLSFLNKKNIL